MVTFNAAALEARLLARFPAANAVAVTVSASDRGGSQRHAAFRDHVIRGLESQERTTVLATLRMQRLNTSAGWRSAQDMAEDTAGWFVNSSAPDLSDLLEVPVVEQPDREAVRIYLKLFSAPPPPPPPPRVPLPPLWPGITTLPNPFTFNDLKTKVEGCEVHTLCKIFLPPYTRTYVTATLKIKMDQIVHILSWDEDSAVLDGGGQRRLFAVESGGDLTLEHLTLHNGSAVQGGAVFVLRNARLTVLHALITECVAESGPHLGRYGDAEGGAIFTDPTSDVLIRHTKIMGCKAIHRQDVGNARAGAVYVTGNVIVEETEMTNCEAINTISIDRGVGGAVFVAGEGMLLMRNGTLMRANRASGQGNSYFASGGTAMYQLPAPPGYWIAGTPCKVYREGCELDVKGNTLNEDCPLARDKCSTMSQPWDGVAPTVQITSVCENGQASCSKDVQCERLTKKQHCPWDIPESTSFMGSLVEVLPQGEMAQEDFPLPCAPSILGSIHPKFQASARCAGRCVRALRVHLGSRALLDGDCHAAAAAASAATSLSKAARIPL